MLLSICMIVKNEEGNLERCLSSLLPLMKAVPSELIIVDTGSTDNTVAIAQKYTDKIYIHPWENDYSKMRNYTLGYAFGGWFFLIDADEELKEWGPIVKFLKSGKSRQYNAACVKIHSLYKTEDTGRFTAATVARLFRKTETFRFEGAIHEQPLYDPPLFMLDAVLIHYGYVIDDPEMKNRKLQLYEPILMQALEENPLDVYLWYQLSKTYVTYKNVEAALAPAIKAYEIIKTQNLKPSDYLNVYTNLANLYLMNGNLEKTEEIAEEGLKIKKWVVDLWFYIAKAQAIGKKQEEAIQSYKKYLYYVEHYSQYAGEDVRIINFTFTNKEEAYLDLFNLNREIGRKSEAFEELRKIESAEVLCQSFGNVADLLLDLQEFGYLESLCRELKFFDNEEMIDKFMDLARQAGGSDEAAYVRSLRSALREYPEMKKGIEFLLKKISDKMPPAEPAAGSELESYAKIIKTNIKQLIGRGMLKEAGELILQFEQIIPNDSEIGQMKASIGSK